MTLWHGRFESGPADELLEYTASLHFDRRLAAHDIAASQAHIGGLARSGLISSEEYTAIRGALETVASELDAKTFQFAAMDEDIHTAVERRVTELAGDAGAKLHTGRSRNDQVATDLRLWCRDELSEIAHRIVVLQETLVSRAREAGDAYLPGYTHMQRAQPVLLGHHLLAHAWALARDVDRIVDCRRRLDVSPLGAGALGGSSLPLDPDGVAAELGFGARFDNSLDAVSDRDFVAESLFVLALIGIHLSRIGEELVLWATQEFGFIALHERYSTGSSMLPQKKNPDIAELARGKAGRLIGHLAGVLAMLKGLPLAYNRDLQEDKEPLFDAFDAVRLGLGALTGTIATATFDVERMRTAADDPTSVAVDLAEWLVVRGMPFRSAHAVVGSVVREALERGLPLAELVAAHPELGIEAVLLLEPGTSVERRTSPGGAGPASVVAQLEAIDRRLDTDRRRIVR